MEMTAKERVKQELFELIEKYNKLNSFIEKGQKFNTLPKEMQMLLKEQLYIMYGYIYILRHRLEIWGQE